MRFLRAFLITLSLLTVSLAWAQVLPAADVVKPGSVPREPQATAIFDHMAVAPVTLLDDDGRTRVVEVKMAVSLQEHRAGFQFVSSGIIDKSLILFVFPAEIITCFHMRNVETSLDIAFIGSDGKILDIQQMQPDPGGNGAAPHVYGPLRPFRYALEARAGFFKAHGISAGKGLLLFQ